MIKDILQRELRSRDYITKKVEELSKDSRYKKYADIMQESLSVTMRIGIAVDMLERLEREIHIQTIINKCLNENIAITGVYRMKYDVRVSHSIQYLESLKNELNEKSN